MSLKGEEDAVGFRGGGARTSQHFDFGTKKKSKTKIHGKQKIRMIINTPSLFLFLFFFPAFKLIRLKKNFHHPNPNPFELYERQ
jgi:hypothetical protein